MAAYEGSFKSLLQGVSQQVARERLDGQVSDQLNMLSDEVTNLRRRPGAGFLYNIEVGYNYQPNAFVAFDTVVGTERCQVVVDAHQGIVRVFDSANVLVYTSPTITYLWTTLDPLSTDQADASKIQAATVGGELFLANTNKQPHRGAATLIDHAKMGFVYIKAGEFNKKYVLTVSSASSTYAVSYTTPDGTGATDADVSTPEYIASQLQILIQSGSVPGTISSTAYGSNIVVICTAGTLSLESPTGLLYVVASNKGHIRQEADLPPNPGGPLNGYIIEVGDSSNKRYYQYNLTKDQWLESGDRTSPLTLINCPVAVRNIEGVWSMETTSVFEGRFAGDDDTNGDPHFMEFGITGLASYQSRLVILSGNMVDLSASNLPRRFYRSTVTSLLDNDRIGIGNTGTTAAEFRHAVQFNKDLHLFSDRNQAFIPGSQQAITPRTALVLPSSEYAADTMMKPLQVGQGLMYSAPRSSQNFGMLEMLPTGTADNQYKSSDVTAHLPTFMPGRCRFACASSVSNLVVFGSTVETASLYVHEYIWDRDEKVQQAWHRWDFPFEVSTAYFSGDSIVVLFRNANQLTACKIEPQGSRVVAGYTAPFLDVFAKVTVVDQQFTLPAWLAALAPSDVEREWLRLSNATGSLAGTAVGVTYSAGVFTTPQSFKNGEVYVGFPYTSLVTPTAPMRKDSKGVLISTNKMTVLRYSVSTNKSGEFQAEISDAVPDDEEGEVQVPVLYNSPELSLGEAVIGADTAVVIPARTRAENTVLTLSTSGLSEFNLVGLEFVAQYHEKLRRER